MAIARTRLLADNDRKAIYFDGALPLGKRQTRLERLERARTLLENYRKQRTGPFKSSSKTSLHASGLTSELSIWKKKFPAPGHSQQLLLPPPPFMVACVLDDLRNDSTSTYPVQVVPGEADSYCATIAKTAGAAILSNDSDMTMYDLGSEGSLVLLDTLDLALGGNMNHNHKLQCHFWKAQRIYPSSIARRLNLTMLAGVHSLLRLGFERASDTSAPAGTIRSRCTATHYVGTSDAFEQFCELYKESKETGTAEDVPNPLVQLDPRLSELHCQYNCIEYMVQSPHGPHIYMPLMVEDPNRDSSWTYGKGFRLLAYSLLKHSAENTTNVRHHECVIEFQRRGPRVVGVPLKLLDTVEMLSSIENIVRDLRENTIPVNDSLRWRVFGLKEVNEEKARNGKPSIPLAWATEFLSLGYVDGKLSWEDIHVYANVQAVLYSLWILKQACAVVKPQKDLRTLVDKLVQALQPPVSLRCLIASRWEIASSSQDIPNAVIAQALDRADLQHTGPKQNRMVRNTAPGTDHATSKATLAAQNQRHRANGNIFELLSSS
jgi:hypothetical protein